MSNYKTYQTSRLFLKPTSEEDAEFILKLMNTPKWLKNIGDRNVKSEEDARIYIKNKMLQQLLKLGYSNYTMILKSDKTKIGTCGLYNREGLNGIDIGFSLLPNFEKQGYAFEAASKIKDLAFNTFNIKTIKAITTKDNLASQKLLEKLGLENIGTTTIPNDDEELLLYSLTNPSM